ncbi:hypothetical protein RB195_004810 [Necator americanus]|uniref:Uncharacterized protein n=1 Tax=Necator americanus TaxID=51031 RepID=A0ABR1BNR3_NECAM
MRGRGITLRPQQRGAIIPAQWALDGFSALATVSNNAAISQFTPATEQNSTATPVNTNEILVSQGETSSDDLSDSEDNVCYRAWEGPTDPLVVRRCGPCTCVRNDEESLKSSTLIIDTRNSLFPWRSVKLYIEMFVVPETNATSVTEDIVKEAARNLLKLSRVVTDHIFVLNAIPRPLSKFLSIYEQSLRKHHPINPAELLSPGVEVARRRVAESVATSEQAIAPANTSVICSILS